MYAIVNGKIIMPDKVLENKVLVFNKQIVEISDEVPANHEVIDARGNYVAPGLIDVHVNINGLESSTADVMLDTTFESVDALKAYAVNPKHVAVADGKVRPYTAIRSCLDYEV